MAGKAQINIEVGIQQAQSAIADLEAQIAGFKAQMDEISGAMFQTPDQRTGAFAGMSYEDLTAQFGQVQQQYLAAQEKLEALDGTQRELAASEVASAQKVAEGQKKVQEAVEQTTQSYRDQMAAQRAAAENDLQQLGLVENAWMKNAAAAREYGASLNSGEVAQSYQAVAANMDALASSEEAATAGGADFAAIADTVGVRMGAVAEETQAAAHGTNLWHSMNQGVIGDLRLMRYSMYAFTTPLMFTYVIPQIETMVQGIQAGISAMEGFDAAAQKAFQDFVKGSNDALVAFRGLTIQQKIWEGEQLEAQTQQRINFDISIRHAIEAQSYWHNLGTEIKAVMDALGGNPASLGAYAAQFGIKAGALKDELTQEALLSKQHAELARLEKQLQEQQSKTKNSTDKFSSSLQKADEVIASTKLQVPGLISNMDRLKQALMFPNMQEDQLLWNYAKLNAQRLDEGLQPLSATLKQLNIELPKLTMPAIPLGVLDGQIDAVKQLTAAQRLMLPTERELQVAIEQLTKSYPQLTRAEVENLAQVRLQDPAFRKAIDDSSRVTRSIHDQGIAWNQLSIQVRTAVSQMTGELTGWGGVASRVFDQMFNAVSRQIEIEQKQAGATQLSASLTAKATLDGLKQLAPVKAIVDTAKGLEELAEAFMGHPGAAAAAVQDFAAAAMWGTVGAFQIASMAGAFNPGSGGGSAAAAVATAGTSSAGSSASPPALASGAASAAAAQNGGSQQHTIQVIFKGNVYGAGGMKEVIRQINNEVKFNRQQLVASHTVTGKALR